MVKLPGPTSLQIEQFEMQEGKTRWRTLDRYDREIFPVGQSAAADFLGTAAAGASCMVELLQGLSERKAGRGPVCWTDMAGGLGIALREVSLLQTQGILREVVTTNVDLFDWSGALKEELEDISAEYGEDLANPDHAPGLIIGNAEDVSVDPPSDLITCVQAIQYFNDPLKALANWYNQLNDKGIVIMARRGATWSPDITRQDRFGAVEVFPSLLSQLDEHGINYAVDQPSRRDPGGAGTYRDGIDVLAIQRNAGTSLKLNSAVEEVLPVGDEDLVYKKAVRYDSAYPPIEVVTSC